MARQPTLGDVARVAGVSATTVSRVINNRGYLSEATRRAVHAAMDQLGYLPNAAARQLKLNRKDVVGVVIPSLRDPFYAELVSHLDAVAAASRVRLIIAENEPGDPREASYLDLVRAGQVDGLITGAHSDVVVDLADVRSLPVTTIDRTHPASIANVSCDNFAGAYEMTRLLLSRADGDIAFVASTIDPDNRRQQGYTTALTEDSRSPHMVELGFGKPRSEQAETLHAFLDGLAASPGRPAVFCTNDVYAALTLDWARQRSLAVPADVLVAGFDGTELMRTVAPTLATVQQPLDEIARAAMDIVLSLRDDREPAVPAPFPVTLIDAESAGARPKP